MLSETQTKRQEATTKQKLLTTTNPENVAMVLYNQLVGLDTIEGSVVIEGIESVRNTVVREFGEVSKPGDEIRVIAPATVLDRGLGKSGMAEMSLMARAMDGDKSDNLPGVPRVGLITIKNKFPFLSSSV